MAPGQKRTTLSQTRLVALQNPMSEVHDDASCAACADADEAVPFGWSCVNCGAKAASKRRRPNKEFCSKGPCRRLAGLASASVKDDANVKRIATLEAKVRDQATTITLLQKQLAEAQAALERAKAASSSKAATAATAKPVAPRPTAKPAVAPAQARPTNHPALVAMLQASRSAAPPKTVPAVVAPPTNLRQPQLATAARRPAPAGGGLSQRRARAAASEKGKGERADAGAPGGLAETGRRPSSSRPGEFSYLNSFYKLKLCKVAAARARREARRHL